MNRLRLLVAVVDGKSSGFAELERQLEAQGVDCTPMAGGESVHPRLVLSGAIDPALLEKVRTHSRLCHGRLLVARARQDALGEDTVWSLLGAGAADVLCGPPADLARSVTARLERWYEVDRLLSSPAVQRNLVGASPAWHAALSQIVEVARFTGASVLVTGESGTGKELAARLVHTLDARQDKGDLVLVDCTTLSPDLAGSELFGHERGAFTHAHQARDGAFSLADGGTLFLDEVGELPLKLQAELLRAIQEGTYKRLGSNRWNHVRFRLVCATNRDLAAEVEAGRFRADLYWRLATWTCCLPPLRRRQGDVPLLVDHFLCEELGREQPPTLDPAVLNLLARREYPGNVRDLKHLVARIAHHHVGDGPISVGDLPREEWPTIDDARAAAETAWNGDPLGRAVRRALAQGAGLEEIKNQAADAAVRLALSEEPDQQQAAERLGISRRAVQMRLAAMRERGEVAP